MTDTKNLFESITTKTEAIRNFSPEVLEIPKYITDNIKHDLFKWQKEALENFLYYENPKSKLKSYPTHLMFNMATGTGKTLLMASCILYYYKKGYRKFIFFVNQNNIIDKTENNFINSTHGKYLFKDNIFIDNKSVKIKKVDTFSNNDDYIEIKFTTIQKLYNDIHILKENQVYLDDLIKENIVMLADEAHHLNADTKQVKQLEFDLETELKETTSSTEVERKGWEHTVIELILNKNGNRAENKNVLLEFTATIPNNKRVIDKYAPKTIYKFELKDFLSAGYTKEINLISSTLEKKERMLQALLFSWYRHKIALKHSIPNFKPVILFRSKTIEASKNDFESFLQIVKSLDVSDFSFLSKIEDTFYDGNSVYEQGKSRILDLINFIQEQNINKSEIVTFIKDNFTERNCIITNSKTNTAKTKEKTDESQEKLLNSLEDRDNHIRAIFSVNRLTEGWDVLNLFDIVRLYSGRDEGKSKNGKRKAGSTTISEIQLIGRGVRYYPFNFEDKLKNKRKFDNQLDNELRVIEELYYHSDSDHRYIDELKRELKNKGFIDDGKIVKKFNLKKAFKESGFYNNIKIFKNKQIENPEKKQKTIEYIKNNLQFKFDLTSFGIKEEQVDFESTDEDKERLEIADSNRRAIVVSINDFDKHIFEKAQNIKASTQNSLLRFNSLKDYFDVKSVEEFRKKVLGDFEIKIVSKQKSFDEITNKQKLKILLTFLDKLLLEIKQNTNLYIGSEFTAHKLEEFFENEVVKSVKQDNESQDLENELKYEDWYVVDQFYGTSEEKGLIAFIQETILNLQEKYKEVYLLRNEEQYKIYDFHSGKGFQPDFILFLKDESKMVYQIFIEPKGDNLLNTDEWKNSFLKEISIRYSSENIIRFEGKNYVLIGLPLFNKNESKEFTDSYERLIN